ncbi:hypothetical protein ONZ45_g6736 [Pleurotus djamor]|nr:hypothetical protein ONZ45_g6736 [Pleurotus djamor]
MNFSDNLDNLDELSLDLMTFDTLPHGRDHHEASAHLYGDGLLLDNHQFASQDQEEGIDFSVDDIVEMHFAWDKLDVDHTYPPANATFVEDEPLETVSMLRRRRALSDASSSSTFPDLDISTYDFADSPTLGFFSSPSSVCPSTPDEYPGYFWYGSDMGVPGASPSPLSGGKLVDMVLITEDFVHPWETVSDDL